MYQDLASRPKFALNTDGSYPSNTAFCIPIDNGSLLAYLNSKRSLFWITRHCPANHGGAYRLFNQSINKLPVDPRVPNHRDLGNMAQQAIDLVQRERKCRTDHERSEIEHQIEHTDSEIDQLVYELYGLSDKEIALVEEATI
jgi:hypothetical protein